MKKTFLLLTALTILCVLLWLTNNEQLRGIALFASLLTSLLWGAMIEKYLNHKIKR